jgi:transcriptional regulator with XRE-family HTH domain
MTVVEVRAGVGDLLRAWRTKRRMSQFDLSLAADVSTRHLSYVETGRAKPSRSFLLHVAEHLDLPLRARNDLLVAGGYAPVYGETELAAPAMAEVRHALDLVLAKHEPYPALVVDRCWNLVLANGGAAVLWEDLDPSWLEGTPNVLRASLHPDGMASRIEDLDVVSGHLLSRLRRQAAITGDPRLAELYDELASYPGVTVTEPLSDHPGVVLPVRFRHSRGMLSFFTTLATFGTAADVTVSELTVECFFPADEATRQALTLSA